LLILGATIPVVAAFIISAISHSIITARYFLFSQVFLLAATAVVACRVPRQGRYAAIGLVLCGMASLSYSHYRWREGAARLPGMQAAVAKLETTRGDAPLVVSNPMLFTSVLTYIGDRSHVYNYQPRWGFPMYQGTPVMRDEDYVDTEWLEKTEADLLWT